MRGGEFLGGVLVGGLAERRVAQEVAAAAPDGDALVEGAGETAAQQVSWDPVAAYHALREEPIPRPYPWMQVARGLGAVGREDLGVETWWTALRLDPLQGEALAAMDALEPGGVVQRMEGELRRHRYFPERTAMEAYLVPRWVESGRLEAAEACVDLDRVLKKLRDTRFLHTSARPNQVHRLRLLAAARPHDAEMAIVGLLEREPNLMWREREVLERVQGLAEGILVDAGGDPRDRAANLTELARLFALRGDRSRALELIDAALGVYADQDAWELRRQLELGREPRDL